MQQADADPAYGRSAGQWNIITETRKLNERVKQNISRALTEELERSYNQFGIVPRSYRETNESYVEMMGYAYKFRCLCLMWAGNPHVPANKVFHSTSGELLDYQWVSPDELALYDIEFGARMVIEYYKRIG